MYNTLHVTTEARMITTNLSQHHITSCRPQTRQATNIQITLIFPFISLLTTDGSMMSLHASHVMLQNVHIHTAHDRTD